MQQGDYFKTNIAATRLCSGWWGSEWLTTKNDQLQDIKDLFSASRADSAAYLVPYVRPLVTAIWLVLLSTIRSWLLSSTKFIPHWVPRWRGGEEVDMSMSPRRTKVTQSTNCRTGSCYHCDDNEEYSSLLSDHFSPHSTESRFVFTSQ